MFCYGESPYGCMAYALKMSTGANVVVAICNVLRLAERTTQTINCKLLLCFAG